MLPPQYPGYYEPRNHPAYIRSLEAPTPALADILPNQSHNAVHIKEEAVELALYEISSESSVPPQAQEVLPFATPTTQLPTSAAADPVLPIVKQEADIEEFRAHKRWVDCKNWLSELWKNLPAVPSTRSRRAWAKARGFLPATVHKWFGSKKHAYKRKHLAVHPQDGYELPVDEPRESLLVSLTPGIQPSSLGHTPAFGASSSPFPQTPDDFESLDTQINALEPSSSNVKSKSTKRKAQAPVIPPLFSLAPGAQSGYISVPAQANTADLNVVFPAPPPAKRGRKRKVQAVADPNAQTPAESENVSKRRNVKATSVADNGLKTLDSVQPTGTSVATYGIFGGEKGIPQTYPPGSMLNLPVARTYQFKLGQGEPKATWKDLELAAVQLPKISGNSRVELAKAPVDPAIPLGLHQSMKSYPPPPFFLDRAKGIKQIPQVPTSLNFPPHSLASMLYTSYLIAPFPSDGTALMSSNLPAGHPMDWFAPPQTIPSCLEIESKQTSSPSPPFGVLKVSAADAVDWALTVRKSHEINSELGLWNPEVEDLPPWKYESEMEFDVGAEWP